MSLIPSYPTIVRSAAGAIMGATTTSSWAGALFGSVTSSLISSKTNPHLTLISSIASSALFFGFKNYIWNQYFFALAVSVLTPGLIHKELAHEAAIPSDITLIGYYLVQAVTFVASYKLGKGLLIGLAGAGLFIATRKSTLSEISGPGDALLNDSQLEKAKSYIDEPAKLEQLPRAPYGKNTVYFLEDIVLKQVGFSENGKRLENMRIGHQICKQNGYVDLVIPKAQIHEDYLVESRLSIPLGRFKEQIGLYIENRDRFTNAVKEFTGFLFQTPIDGLSGRYGDPCTYIPATAVGRYDNLCLHLEGERGKIGLVDLERLIPVNLSPSLVPIQKEEFLLNLKRRIYRWLVRFASIWLKTDDQKKIILPHHALESVWYSNLPLNSATAMIHFPLHFEEILSVTEKFIPITAELRTTLDEVRKAGLAIFEEVYGKHLRFLNNNNVSLANPNAPLRSCSGINLSNALVEKLSDGILSFSENPFFQIFFEEERNQALINDEICPDLLTGALDLINAQIRAANAARPPQTMNELLSNRSFVLEGDAIDALMNRITAKLDCFQIEAATPTNKAAFAQYLFNTLVQQLVKEGIVCFYNPFLGIKRQRYIFC